MIRLRDNDEYSKEDKATIIKNLLESKHYDAILSFLSNLEANELFGLSKSRGMENLRKFLNDPYVFKKLFEMRNDPLEKDVKRFFENVNYWQLWLSTTFARQEFNEDASPTMVVANNSIRFVFQKHTERNFRLQLKIFLNPQNLPEAWYNEYYTALNIENHPIALKYVNEVKGFLRTLSKRNFRNFTVINPARQPDAEGFYEIGWFGLGYIRDYPRLSIFHEHNPDLIPYNFIDALGYSKDFETLKELSNSEIYAKIVNNDDDATTITYAFNCMVVSSFAYFFLMKDASFFVNANYEVQDFGVSYLRNCIECNDPAKYMCPETNDYFCSFECHKSYNE